MTEKQVNSLHYAFSRYVDKRRWASLWHQLDEVLALKPKKVLEIGPGPGIFKAVAEAFGVKVETLDIDPELKPDHVACADKMPFDGGSYDVVCAFQMLEHVPYDTSLAIFREMVRVAERAVVVSLPDARPTCPVSIHAPRKAGDIRFFIPMPWAVPTEHQFDGEHYWEINKKYFPLEKIQKDFQEAGEAKLTNSYRVVENPFHRFFVFEKK